MSARTSMGFDSRAVVVGGGLSGLLAARRLARTGHHVTLLESREELGGAIAAAEVGGLTINTGAEAYSTRSGAVDALLQELGLGDAIVSPDSTLSSRLVSQAGTHRAPSGSLFGIPANPTGREARAVIGWLGALRALADRVLPASVGLRPGVTLGALVRTRMGDRVADRLVAPLVAGVHSADPDSLELATVLPRLPEAMRTEGSLAAAVRALRPSPEKQRSAGTAVHAVAPTMATLIQTLADSCRDLGVELRTASPVSALQREGSTWAITVGPSPTGPSPHGTTTAEPSAPAAPAAPAAPTEVLHAEYLVLACPPDVSRRLLTGVEDEIAQRIPDTPPTPVRLVALVLEDSRLDTFPTGTGALVAPGTPQVWAKAMTHATAKWPHVREAAGDLHVLRLSYGRPGEPLPVDDSGGPDGTSGSIIDLALLDASAITGVDLSRESLRGARVITWEQSMRRPGPGHREALAQLTTALEDTFALELVGSWRCGTGIDAIVRADAALGPDAPPGP